MYEFYEFWTRHKYKVKGILISEILFAAFFAYAAFSDAASGDYTMSESIKDSIDYFTSIGFQIFIVIVGLIIGAVWQGIVLTRAEAAARQSKADDALTTILTFFETHLNGTIEYRIMHYGIMPFHSFDYDMDQHRHEVALSHFSISGNGHMRAIARSLQNSKFARDYAFVVHTPRDSEYRDLPLCIDVVLKEHAPKFKW